ncbi:MAG: electron transfer flavoprotein subunit alpha/FixB family protein [Phycisphaerales bacterium]|nr:electron transfer flavoprotein subunit alpha/FixB family protein [Phycisphaerales bacterium]
MPADVFVFGEQRNDRLHPAALQAVTAARALAQQTGDQVVGVIVGSTVGAASEALGGAGVDRLLVISDPALEHYSVTRYRTALCAAVASQPPRALLLPATFMGRDLAPRLGAALGAAVVTDAVAVAVEGEELVVQRPVYNGKASCRVALPAGRLAIVSLRPNAFAAPRSSGSAVTAEILPFSPAAGDERITVQSVAKAGGGIKDVAEADIIVSGGRSLKSEENFRILYELAAELDGAVGASRAACDAGYQTHSRQVGLTGKTVTPRLYIACGISGAIQHLAGMRGSKVIVAINTDREAPIFKLADYGVVGDLFKVVPALTAAVKELHARS